MTETTTEEIERELRKPETRTIIGQYMKASQHDYYRLIGERIEEEHPTAHALMQEMLKCEDPVAMLEENKGAVEKYRELGKQMQFVLLMTPASETFDEVQELVAYIDAGCQSIEQDAPWMEERYFHMARIIQELSDECQIAPEQVINSKALRDEVIRRQYPTVEEARAAQKRARNFADTQIELSRGLLKIIDNNGPLPEEMQKKADLLPNEEDYVGMMDLLEEAFERDRLRVYSVS